MPLIVLSHAVQTMLFAHHSIIRVLALCIRIVLLDEVVFCDPGRHTRAIRRPARSCAGCCLLRDRVTGVHPVGVDVDGRRKICPISEFRSSSSLFFSSPHTVDVGLECLSAHFALEVANAGFLLNRHRDRLLVIAEETLEGRRQLLLLRNPSAPRHSRAIYANLGNHTFLGPCGLLDDLRFPLHAVSMSLREP